MDTTCAQSSSSRASPSSAWRCSPLPAAAMLPLTAGEGVEIPGSLAPLPGQVLWSTHSTPEQLWVPNPNLGRAGQVAKAALRRWDCCRSLLQMGEGPA